LLQRRRDCLNAALLTALQKEPCNFLDEQRYAPDALRYAFDHLLRQRVAGGKLLHHTRRVYRLVQAGRYDSRTFEQPGV
jgi:hypothetical protein